MPLFGGSGEPTMVFGGAPQPVKKKKAPPMTPGSSELAAAAAEQSSPQGKREKRQEPAAGSEASAAEPSKRQKGETPVPPKPKAPPPKKKQDAIKEPTLPPEEQAERDTRTIFVGNVPVDTKHKVVKRHFATYGDVETVFVRSVAGDDPKMPKRAALITGSFDKTVKETFNVYVVFKAADSVPKAVAANGQLALGRHLRIDRVTGQKGAGSSAPTPEEVKRSVFLGNLPFNVQEEQVRQLFEACGEVANVRLVRDQATQQGKGFGYVLFTERGAVETALGMHEKLMLVGPMERERPVRVFRCTALKATKGAREAAERMREKGARAGQAAPMGAPGAARGFLARTRKRELKQAKLKTPASAKLKKQRQEKVDNKKRRNLAKRGEGFAPGKISKKAGGGGKKGGKKAGPGKSANL